MFLVKLVKNICKHIYCLVTWPATAHNLLHELSKAPINTSMLTHLANRTEPSCFVKIFV